MNTTVPGPGIGASWFVYLLLAAVLVGGCKSTGGGYYQDDGPPRGVSASDIEKIPNAVPKLEPRSKTGNNPYTALGKKYYPMQTASGYREVGWASWYGKKFHGRRTSSGETYDMLAMTAAHPTLPLPTYVKVRNLKNDRSVIVKVNDRGPFLHDRIIDLSYAAAYKLGVVATGTGWVEVHTVTPASAQKVSADRDAYQPINKPLLPGAKMFVQYGAFSVRSNALDLRNRLQADGFSPFIEQGIHNGRDVYRVRVGPYSEISEADQVTKKSRKSGYETKLVIE